MMKGRISGIKIDSGGCDWKGKGGRSKQSWMDINKHDLIGKELLGNRCKTGLLGGG